MFATKCWLTHVLEIAALAFNKIILLFFYNIKHFKFQSSNTTDHWLNKNTHVDYWVFRMQYQQNLFYTSFNLSATTTYHEGQIKKMIDFLKIFSQIHLWITENPDDHVVIKVQMIISNWSKMFPKQSFWKKNFKILQKPNWAQCSKNPKKSQTKTLDSPKNAQSPNKNFAAQTESQKPSLGWKAQIWQHCQWRMSPVEMTSTFHDSIQFPN